MIHRTKRLILRPWTKADLIPFAALNADPRVMEHFPSTLTRKQSDALASTIITELETHKYGLWAVEIPSVAPFIGFIGLHKPTFEADFTPCIEIGWRLAYEYWGKGYAYEGASYVLDYALTTLQLPEIYSFTYVNNTRSKKLMQKLGLVYDKNFDHPSLPEGHPLRPHVLYRTP